MDPEILKDIGLGGGGGVVGVILAFFGFKSRIDAVEKKVCLKVDKETCVAVKDGMNTRFDDLHHTLDNRFNTLETLIKEKE